MDGGLPESIPGAISITNRSQEKSNAACSDWLMLLLSSILLIAVNVHFGLQTGNIFTPFLHRAIRLLCCSDQLYLLALGTLELGF